jgi:energy-converting hydrogenase B subunit D
MTALFAILLAFAAMTGAGVVLSREPRRQAIAIGVNGLVLTLLFLALQAPDVAYSELVVGAAALPLLFLVALSVLRRGRRPQ